MTRATMLFQSALTGLVMGVIAGVALLALLTLAVNLLPGVPERLIERLRLPLVALLIGVVPVVAALLGYLEGRAKLP